MTTITDQIYSAIASKLLEQLNLAEDYFNGNIVCDCGETSAKLTCSIIIYRKRLTDNGSVSTYLENIVPVWWSCQTYHSGEATNNDFSWSEFKTFLYGTI